MDYARIAGLLTFVGGTLTAQQSHNDVQILFVSDFFHGQVADTTGEQWFGLFPADSGWELDLTTIRVEPANAGCMENGSRVTVDRPAHPVLLLRGAPWLQSGPLQAVPVPRQDFNPPASHEFRFGAHAFVLVATGDAANYELRLVRSADNKAQTLVAFHAHGNPWRIAWSPKVLWIGDLDHDGQPDLFVDVHMFETPGDWVLFLSSRADQDELVHQAAEFRGVDC